MTKCTTRPIHFTSCKSRLVQADFTGGDITSDGGAVLLREMDRRLKLTSSIARYLSDNRRKKLEGSALTRASAAAETIPGSEWCYYLPRQGCKRGNAKAQGS